VQAPPPLAAEPRDVGEPPPQLAKSAEPVIRDNELNEQYAGVRPLRTYRGAASFYADMLTGRLTANGERYDPEQFTAAHRSLPFGTILRVTRRDSGRATTVRVTDRGPFGPRGRIVDLSRAAARDLQMEGEGVVDVRIEVLEYGQRR
jgi:rare lipoprotein A